MISQTQAATWQHESNSLIHNAEMQYHFKNTYMQWKTLDLHGVLRILLGLRQLFLPHLFRHLRLLLHLREALAAHLLGTQAFLGPQLGGEADNVWWFGRGATNLAPREQCYINLWILKHVPRGQTLTPFLVVMGFFFPMRDGFTSVAQQTTTWHQVAGKLRLFQNPTEHDKETSHKIRLSAARIFQLSNNWLTKHDKTVG